MAVGLSSLPSKTIFFDDAMVLKLGTIKCTLSHVPTLHAIPLAQVLEVVEDTPQRRHVLLQVRAEIMRMPPQVVHQALPSGVGEVTLDTSLLQCLRHGYFGNIGAKKTASGKIRRESPRRLCQRIAIVRRNVEIRISQPCRSHPARFLRADPRTVQPGLRVASKRP